jgi:transcription initiation factor TFIID subunit TAF12
MRDVTIRAVLNGFVVKVGCQEVVFESRERLLSELDRYLTDPNTVEQEYREQAVNKELLNETRIRLNDEWRVMTTPYANFTHTPVTQADMARGLVAQVKDQMSTPAKKHGRPRKSE